MEADGQSSLPEAPRNAHNHIIVPACWLVLGGGVERSLNIFGITAPGWFMKTEYRSAFYDRISLPTTIGPGFAPAVGPTGTAITFKPWVQTISTSLVYRFNWGGAPAGANY